MNKNTFERIVEDTLGIAQKVLTRKSKEYASDDDKLHNFEQAKNFMRCKTKEYALWGMLSKHLVSVTDIVEKFEKNNIVPTSNMLDEKIGDSILYLILLKICFYDDMIKEEAEKPVGYDCKMTIDELRNKREELRKIDEKMDEQARVMSIDEIFKQNEGAMANSMYQNPRKRLVVENLRKMLKSLFVWLTDNNRFVDYEKIKGILNRAELERDHVPDELIKDVVVKIERLDIPSADWYIQRDKVITQIIQIMMRPKYKIGDRIWTITSDAKEKIWKVCNTAVAVDSYALYGEDKAICYKGLFGEMLHEKFCFKSKEEAQQECDNRNKTNIKG